MSWIEDTAIHEVAISMIEDDPFWKLMKVQGEIFLEKILIGKVSDDKFISRWSDKVLWQNVDGDSVKSTARIGIKEFLDAMSKYYVLFKEKGNFPGSTPFLLKDFLRFEEWNLKDLLLVCTSENSYFQLNNDLGIINNADE